MFHFRKKAVEAAFAVGTRVRVKAGTADPDYPNMCLAGWVGAVCRVKKGTPARYLVRWNRETLRKWNKFWRREIWLSGEQLETDSGGPVSIEQPPTCLTDLMGGCSKMQHLLPQT